MTKVDFFESIEKPWGKDASLFKYNDLTWEILKDKYENHSSISGIIKTNIPKIIHQIWLGGEIPKNVLSLAEKIKDLNSDWEFKFWTDHNLVFIENEYFLKIKSIKNFGVQSDIIRYLILDKFGGIYLDCDFLPIKKFQDLLSDTCFLAGICNPDENNKPVIANGLIGSIPNHPLLQSINFKIKNKINKLLDLENQTDIFLNTGPTFFTNEILEFIKGNSKEKIVIFPSSYFYPINYRKRYIINSKMIEKHKFKETYLIHLWDTSWFKSKKNIKSYLKNIIPLRYLNFILKFKKK